MQLPENFLCLDVETSALDPSRGSLLSLGAIKSDGSKFYRECRPWDGAVLDPKAIQINGYDPAKWDCSLSEAELLEAFFDWLGTPAQPGLRWIMAGRNPGFDYNFLKAALRRSGSETRLSSIISRRLIDLHPVIYLAAFTYNVNVGESNLSLDQLYQRLTLPIEGEVHNALTGAELCMFAFSSLDVKLVFPF